ncbi:MAG TPA: sulfatase-like hydrolase/transferase, partial [Acidimicrobiia bacterium]|nr:sulfatase-like hydrolase/transferase [Acidimicrobiia bacterium]
MTLARLGTIPWWKVPLSLGAVGAFALAQPLLDLLGRNPEFFIARGFTPLDILLLPLALLALPALLAVPVLILRLVGPRTSAIAHLIALAALFALLVASVWVALLGSETSPWVFGLVSVLGGAVFAIAYLRFPTLQSAVGYASWALVAFPAWFLIMTPASDVAFASAGDLPETGEISNPGPIVMLVFDEFPLATIIDSDGELLDELFPNFAQLAEDGIWYRNGVGVRQQTEEALPTILTGIGADPGSIPIASDHPLNLFTLLSDAYDIAAVETVTDLCPDFACTNSSRRIEPFATRWSALTVDLAVVYGHLALPRELSDGLPPIDRTWGNFTTGEQSDFDIIDRFLANVDADRRLEVDRLLETFEFDGPEPSLRFGHFLYPHHPWELTPDGERTGSGSSPGGKGAGWETDTWLVGQGYQRHILQTQYADTVLGMVTDRMKSEGIYDEALLVVVADHGITIAPGVENQRLITPDTVGTIAAVPMFVKYPARTAGAEPGTIDDVRAETVDLIPTIADVIGARLPWNVDGLSLLDPERALRQESVMVGREGPVHFGVDGTEKLDAAADKEGWFAGGDPWALTPDGWQGWRGLSMSEVTTTDVPDISVAVRQQDLLDELPAEPDVVPSFLSGSLRLDRSASGDEILVVSVDDEI